MAEREGVSYCLYPELKDNQKSIKPPNCLQSAGPYPED